LEAWIEFFDSVYKFFQFASMLLGLILFHRRNDKSPVEIITKGNTEHGIGEMKLSIQILNSKEGGHTMKNIMMLSAVLVFMLGAVDYASGDTMKPSFQVDPIEWSINTAEFHLTQAQKLQQEATDLAARVRELNQKVAKYEKKPYLDTKGFHRDGLKRIIGTTLQKVSALRDQVAWHRDEASRLADLEQVPQDSGSDSDDTTTTLRDTSRSRSRSESPS
jgi:hypothetical protein